MSLASGLLLLLSAATLAGCASSLPNLSVEPAVPLRIPPPPSTSQPPPPGTYWQKHCAFRLSLQERLNVTLERSEHCKALGLDEPPVQEIKAGPSSTEGSDTR